MKVINGKVVKNNKWKQTDHAGSAGFFCGTNKIPVRNGVVSFDVLTEAGKALDIVQKDPAPARTRSNDRDIASLPFGEYEAGFFIAILPYTQVAPGQVGFAVASDVTPEQAQNIIADFKPHRITKDLIMISSYATWDCARQHYKDITDSFEYAVVAFSTPRNLQILAEDPAHYKQYAGSVA
jgi:hypothetical protein